MTARLGIHPLDRCGRLILRVLAERGLLAPPDGGGDAPFAVAALASPEAPATLAHLLRRDSTYRNFPSTVEVEGAGRRRNPASI
jgi:glyceraldehyde-3-phosphate dehydrogenase/erythrose-4-phosphate dehydrogenase